MDPKSRSKNEESKQEILFKKLEDKLKIIFSSMIKTSENTLKTFLDNKVQLYFQKIGGTISDLVDSKYSSVHDRTYLTPIAANTSIGVKSKEEVLLTIELVINDKSINEYIKKYIDELSLIR